MRTKNSIRNSITGFIASFIAMAAGFVTHTVFIKVLNTEYLGLNSLFTNILTLLSVFELGVGNAIVYNLYKPIATNNIKEIKSLVRFYKKAYNIIIAVIFTVGVLLIPFLGLIVGNVEIDVNISIVYILFLFCTLSSYLVAYKRSLIFANQKNYIINIIHAIYILVLNISQLLLLIYTKNYYLYLVIRIVCQILENIVISRFANKLYPYVKETDVEELPKEIEKNITEKVKALFFHKVGSSIVFSTDNILISSFFGVVSVGLYSNYSLIINSVNTLFNQFSSSLTASVGNLLVLEDDNKAFNVFKQVRFIVFWVAAFSATCILFLVQPFITLWLGKDYLLGIWIVVVLVFNYFQVVMRSAYGAFKDSAGIWVEDKFVPLFESIINIICSVVLLKIFGLIGVFIGTTISALVIWCYSFPKFVYKKLFKRSYINYATETLGYMFLFIVVSIITYFVIRLVNYNSVIINLLCNAGICIVIPNLIIYLIFRKSENYKNFKTMIKRFIFKKN